MSNVKKQTKERDGGFCRMLAAASLANDRVHVVRGVADQPQMISVSVASWTSTGQGLLDLSSCEKRA
jgi:hypothetical protein